MLISGQMFLGAKNLGNFEYIYNLRFQAEYVKRFSMENFNNTLCTFLMRDYTKIVAQIGMIWPLIFIVRAIRKKADRLDIFTFILLIYALINIYVFQKIFVHYFEDIHFLLYAVFSCTATLHYIYQKLPSFGTAKDLLFLMIIPMTMTTDTIAGISYFRYRHSGAYTDGYAEASEYINARIKKNEAVIINKLFNIYSNERHIITNRMIVCKDTDCFKKNSRTQNIEYAVIFMEPFNSSFNEQIMQNGKVTLFHNQVAVVEMKERSNLVYKPSSEIVKKSSKDVSPIVLSDDIELIGHVFPEKVYIESEHPYRDYFYSLNKDKFPELKYPKLDIEYYYNKIDKKEVVETTDSLSKKTIREHVKYLATEIRDSEDNLISIVPHTLTNSIFTPSIWPAGSIVGEKVTVFLQETPPLPGEYKIFLSTGIGRFEIGKFYLGRKEIAIENLVPLNAPRPGNRIVLSKALTFVGAEIKKNEVESGEEVAVHTYYEKYADKGENVFPVISVRGIHGGDLNHAVYIDPAPFMVKGKTYQYETTIQIPKSAFGGKKSVDLLVNGKVIPLGRIFVHSKRDKRKLIVEKNVNEESPSIQKKIPAVKINKKRIQINFIAKDGDAVKLLMEAEFGQYPTGYTVIIDTKTVTYNGTALQKIACDTVEKTLLGPSQYSRTIPIPNSLIDKGENHIIIEPFIRGEVNENYPGWRNLFFKMFAPVTNWLLLRQIQPELPPFSYLAVDKQ